MPTDKRKPSPSHSPHTSTLSLTPQQSFSETDCHEAWLESSSYDAVTLSYVILVVCVILKALPGGHIQRTILHTCYSLLLLRDWPHPLWFVPRMPSQGTGSYKTPGNPRLPATPQFACCNSQQLNKQLQKLLNIGLQNCSGGNFSLHYITSFETRSGAPWCPQWLHMDSSSQPQVRKYDQSGDIWNHILSLSYF